MYLRIAEPEWGEPVVVTTGWRRWGSLSFQVLDRETADLAGYLDHEGSEKWLTFHSERWDEPGYHPWRRLGIAMGGRVLIMAWDGINRQYDSDEARAIRQADSDALRTQRGLPPRVMEDEWDWGYIEDGTAIAAE